MYNMNIYDENINLKYNYDIIYKSKNNKYLNLNTGKISTDINDLITREYLLVNFYDLDIFKKMYASYWETSADNEFLCWIMCELDLNNLKDGDIRLYKEVKRYYISKSRDLLIPIEEKKEGEISDRCKYKVLKAGKHREFVYNNYLESNIGIVKNKNDIQNNNNFFIREFVKIFNPIFPKYKEWACDVVRNPFDLHDFLNVSNLEKKNSVGQNILDELCLYKLPDIQFFNFNMDCNAKENVAFNSFLYFNKIDNDIFVIRKFISTNFYLGESDTYQAIFEIARMYYKNYTEIIGVLNNKGEYIINKKNDYTIWNFNFVNFNKYDLSDTRLFYIGDILEEIPNEYRCCFIKLYMNYPVVEKIYRSKLKPIIYATLYNMCESLDDYLIDLLKVEDFTVDDFKKVVGLNNYQIEKISLTWDDKLSKDGFIDYYDELLFREKNFSEIFWLKGILSEENISWIDNDSFDKMLEFVEAYIENARISCMLLFNLNQMYGFSVMVNMIDDVLHVISKGNVNIFNIYYDYIVMVKRLRIMDVYKPYFKDKDDIFRLHDEVTTIYNAKYETYDVEAFKKAIKEVLKYEYTSSNYSIKAPLSQEEIAREGLLLNHCVKSYIERIIERKTNIMFLRKTDDIEKPYYTIEIDNDGVVKQIHGINNSNIESGSELECFIKKWARVKNIKLDNYNIVR